MSYSGLKNRSMVAVHGGQCGIQCASKIWEMMAKEHEIEADQFSTMDFGDSSAPSPHVIYRESSSGRFTPRCVLFDLDPMTIDTIRMSSAKRLFKGVPMISGSEGASNCYARGRYVQGMEILHATRNALRVEMEGCETCIAVVHNSSTSGGTGSGLMPDVLTAESNKTHESLGIQIYPSPTHDNSAGYYNTVLHMDSMTDMVDLNFMSDNESLYNIAINRYAGNKDVTFADINQLIAGVFSNITVGDRFNGENFDLARLQTGLVPYAGLSYIGITVSNYAEPADRTLPFMDVLTSGFSERPVISIDTNRGKYLGLYILTRGHCHKSGKTMEQIHNICQANSFVPWSPCKFSLGHCEENLPEHPPFYCSNRTCVHFFNHSGVVEPFQSFAKWYGVSYAKKSFLHHYMKNGIQIEEMERALQSIAILQRVYKSVTQLSNFDD